MISDFLALNCNLIFNRLHFYAPDNLAWLWAFIDWDTEIDFQNAVPTQEYYQPIENLNILTYEQLKSSPTLFESLNNAPLIQYKYKGKDSSYSGNFYIIL